jgi:hypothetical protein
MFNLIDVRGAPGNGCLTWQRRVHSLKRLRGGGPNRIGRDLRDLYEVPKELPPKLVSLVRKLDDRLLPGVNCQNDEDLFGG